MLLFLPLLSNLKGIPFVQLPSYLKSGAGCFLNIGADTSSELYNRSVAIFLFLFCCNSIRLGIINIVFLGCMKIWDMSPLHQKNMIMDSSTIMANFDGVVSQSSYQLVSEFHINWYWNLSPDLSIANVRCR